MWMGSIMNWLRSRLQTKTVTHHTPRQDVSLTGDNTEVSLGLPIFPYFADPIANGCIIAKNAECICCEKNKSYFYVGPIYSTHSVDEVCAWCVSDGTAAAKFSANFNDVYNWPPTVPRDVVDLISSRTPGYETWQGNRWLFSNSDALVFVGEVDGKALLVAKNTAKISACRAALSDWQFHEDFDLANVKIGGQPSVYLFRERLTSNYKAYADMG